MSLTSFPFFLKDEDDQDNGDDQTNTKDILSNASSSGPDEVDKDRSFKTSLFCADIQEINTQLYTSHMSYLSLNTLFIH